MSTRRQFLYAAAAGVALAGCTDGDGSGATGDGGPVVAMRDTAFDPVRLSVEPGATVEWVNEDGFAHDVTAAQFHDAAADWSFSEEVPAGERATHSFEESGAYEYYCTIHGKETMCGAVLVGGASLDASLPCGSGDGAGGGGGGYY